MRRLSLDEQRQLPPFQRFLHSAYGPWLTHASLLLLTVAQLALLLYAPLWLVLVPCVLIEHRMGILLHDYIHGIPFKNQRYNRAVITFYDGLMLGFGLLEFFRTSHLHHHRWLNTERDPAHQTSHTVKTGRGAWNAFLSLELWQLLVYLWHALRHGTLPVKPWRVVLGFVMSVGWIVFWFETGHWWMWPALHGLIVFTALVPSSLRGAVEHHSFDGDPHSTNEYRAFVPMFNLNRHVHHHYDPTCPWYLLQFVTDRTLPKRAFFTHWIEVNWRKRYVLMQPQVPARAES